MKTLICILFVFIITAPAFAQEPSHSRMGGKGKIEELEKIKLIDALQMDEETTLRFFARRSEHQNKIKELSKKADDQLDKISEYIKNNSDKNTKEIKKMINDYLAYGEDISRERVDFITSLSDILSYEQISKLLIFEKKFRDELRKILFKGMMKNGH